MQVKELFDSIAPQNAENSTVANSLPLFLKYSVKCLFFKRLYQTIENLKIVIYFISANRSEKKDGFHTPQCVNFIRPFFNIEKGRTLRAFSPFRFADMRLQSKRTFAVFPVTYASCPLSWRFSSKPSSPFSSHPSDRMPWCSRSSRGSSRRAASPHPRTCRSRRAHSERPRR